MSTFNPKPGYVCSFKMEKNPNKTETKHPDLVLVNHMTKTGKMAPKNFTIKLNGQDVWCQASGYKQEDGTPRAIHYTEGGPWFKNYRDCEYNEQWKSCLYEMMGQ